jgi:hypothetical protein
MINETALREVLLGLSEQHIKDLTIMASMRDDIAQLRKLVRILNPQFSEAAEQKKSHDAAIDLLKVATDLASKVHIRIQKGEVC